MSETPGDTPIDRRADRYGTTPRPTRRWIPFALGAVVLAAGLGVAYVGFQKYGPVDIDAEQLGYTVVDDSTISVHLKVTRKDPQQPVVCFVRAMARDGKLLLVEAIIASDNAPSFHKCMDLNMLVMTGGKERTEDEYRALFAGAGFELTRIVPTGSEVSVIEARKR